MTRAFLAFTLLAGCSFARRGDLEGECNRDATCNSPYLTCQQAVTFFTGAEWRCRPRQEK